ncbi:hypothetical protein ILYODFUR_029150 [Ilyodon furcidens]|uniref:DET1- and DDB1-associated protein 1 n=1 Tax=Ilyodon furcidens TaxID=33524 RepID=A0ABV0TYL7_9TELE
MSLNFSVRIIDQSCPTNPSPPVLPVPPGTLTPGLFSLHKTPHSNLLTAQEKKRITSVYLQTSMFKKQEEKTETDRGQMRSQRMWN